MSGVENACAQPGAIDGTGDHELIRVLITYLGTAEAAISAKIGSRAHRRPAAASRARFEAYRAARRRSASFSHCAIFSSLAATRAQPSAVPFQR